MKTGNFRFSSVWVLAMLINVFHPCYGTATVRTLTHAHAYFKPSSETRSDALAHAATRGGGIRQTKETTNLKMNFDGSDDCPCIDSSSILSSTITSDCVTRAGSPGFTALSGECYPLRYGTTCAAHEMSYDPQCLVVGNAGKNSRSADAIPSYCYDRWCYVDYHKCKVSNEFFYQSTYAKDKQLVEERDLFYSYSTCASNADSWIEYQTRSSVAQVTLQVTIPRLQFPYHFKYNEHGAIATEPSYYYNDSIPWAGSIIDYLNAVVEISNMHGVNFTSRSRGADKAQSQSSYTASVHDVSAGISDVGGGVFWITSQRLSMTTYSTPFATDKIDLFVKHLEPQAATLWENAQKIVMPFTLTLWMLLFGVIFVTAILIVWLDRREGVSRGIWNKKTSGPHWDRSSKLRKVGIVLKSLSDSFIIHTSHMLGHSVEVDPSTSISQKIIFFGFAVVTFIAIAAYTASLAAFLTLSDNANFVSNMEEAVATNTRVCVNPVLEEEYEAAWPEANFVYNRTAESSGFDALMGMMDLYDAGECDAIGFQLDLYVALNQDYMNEFCKRGLVSTGSYLLEKPLAFPIRREYAAGLSYWMYEAEKQRISFHYFQEQRMPPSLCILKYSRVSSSVDFNQRLRSASMMLPTFLYLACIVIAIFAHMCRSRKKQMHQKNKNQRGEASVDFRNFCNVSRSNSLRFESCDRIIATMDSHQKMDDEVFSDLLQKHHAEIMAKLSEMTSSGTTKQVHAKESAQPKEKDAVDNE